MSMRRENTSEPASITVHGNLIGVHESYSNPFTKASAGPRDVVATNIAFRSEDFAERKKAFMERMSKTKESKSQRMRKEENERHDGEMAIIKNQVDEEKKAALGMENRIKSLKNNFVFEAIGNLIAEGTGNDSGTASGADLDQNEGQSNGSDGYGDNFSSYAPSSSNGGNDIHSLIYTVSTFKDGKGKKWLETQKDLMAKELAEDKEIDIGTIMQWDTKESIPENVIRMYMHASNIIDKEAKKWKAYINDDEMPWPTGINTRDHYRSLVNARPAKWQMKDEKTFTLDINFQKTAKKKKKEKQCENAKEDADKCGKPNTFPCNDSRKGQRLSKEEVERRNQEKKKILKKHSEKQTLSKKEQEIYDKVLKAHTKNDKRLRRLHAKGHDKLTAGQKRQIERHKEHELTPKNWPNNK